MKREQGFTITELIVVFGMLGALLAFSSVRLLGVQHKSQLTSALDTLLSDLKQQQLRAMSGDSAGTASSVSFGILFTPTQYTLFRGAVFSPSDPFNFSVTISPPIEITTTLPDNILVFAKGSGEVLNFSPGGSTLTIQNTASNEQKVITVNQLGTVVSVE